MCTYITQYTHSSQGKQHRFLGHSAMHFQALDCHLVAFCITISIQSCCLNCIVSDVIIIIITEICIAPFPEVNQIKGALQKIEKQFTHTAR